MSRVGHPSLRHPKGADWQTLISEGEAALSRLSDADAQRLAALSSAMAERMGIMSNEAIPARRVHPRMTQATRARIVLAWLIHKRGWTGERLVRLCLSVRRWVEMKVDGQGRSDRLGFAAHILGARLIQHAHVRDVRSVTRTRVDANPSWANEPYRRVEEEVRQTDHASFGPSVSKALGLLILTTVDREVGLGWGGKTPTTTTPS